MADITADDIRPTESSKGQAPDGPSSSFGLWVGIAFCLAYTGLIYVLSPLMKPIDFAPDTGFDHYLWKLPDPTFWSRATAWTGYVLHQAAIWGLIYWAQTRKVKYTNGLNRVNILAMGANAVFILLHLLQTHLWYDGLAQDVHIMTSQGSVVLLLIMVLVMENRRRGIAFGQKAGFLDEPGRVIRKYHGYVFSWAVIWTFWYHPMESTYGHLLGTFYTLLIMLQGSLMFTRAHLNRYWTTALECIVVIHGTMVAVMNANGNWGQFLFGFLAMFIVTQMHGLGLKLWLRWTFIVAYCAAIFGVYSARQWENVSEVIRIPIVEYLLVFMLAALVWGGIWIAGRMSGTDRQIHPAE